MLFHYNINDKWNKLTLVEILEKRVKQRIIGIFKCDCGNENIKYQIARVAHNKIKSCGCEIGCPYISKDVSSLKIKEGEKFGKLLILKKQIMGNFRNTKWLCLCDCGKNRIVTSYYLCRKAKINTRACVDCCRRRVSETSRNNGVGELSGSYWHIIHKGAYSRNLDFNITPEYALELFLQQNRKCKISGLDITLERRSKQAFQTASLDRIDSSKGYIEGNVQWVHKKINKMKMNLSDNDFINLCYIIAKHNTLSSTSAASTSPLGSVV